MAAGWAAPKNLRLRGVKARVQPAKVTKFPKIGSPKMHRTRNHQRDPGPESRALRRFCISLTSLVRWSGGDRERLKDSVHLGPALHITLHTSRAYTDILFPLYVVSIWRWPQARLKSQCIAAS